MESTCLRRAKARSRVGRTGAARRTRPDTFALLGLQRSAPVGSAKLSLVHASSKAGHTSRSQCAPRDYACRRTPARWLPGHNETWIRVFLVPQRRDPETPRIEGRSSARLQAQHRPREGSIPQSVSVAHERPQPRRSHAARCSPGGRRDRPTRRTCRSPSRGRGEAPYPPWSGARRARNVTRSARR